MLNNQNTGQILNPKEFLKAVEEMQADYLQRHENGVAKHE